MPVALERPWVSEEGRGEKGEKVVERAAFCRPCKGIRGRERPTPFVNFSFYGPRSTIFFHSVIGHFSKFEDLKYLIYPFFKSYPMISRICH